MKQRDLRTVRFLRNSYLQKTDKFLISDYPISTSERESVINYRQELRDITSNLDASNSVEELKWPKLPEFLRGKM